VSLQSDTRSEEARSHSTLSERQRLAYVCNVGCLQHRQNTHCRYRRACGSFALDRLLRVCNGHVSRIHLYPQVVAYGEGLGCVCTSAWPVETTPSLMMMATNVRRIPELTSFCEKQRGFLRNRSRGMRCAGWDGKSRQEPGVEWGRDSAAARPPSRPAFPKNAPFLPPQISRVADVRFGN
jgi:hypothetical protein